jgi:hypothetical protein
VTPDERQRAIDDYRAGILRDVERLRAQRELLEGVAANTDAEIEALVQSSARFSFDSLPTTDAPPLVVAILRAEIARAVAHARRARRCVRLLRVDDSEISAAIEMLRVASEDVAKSLPLNTWRKLP